MNRKLILAFLISIFTIQLHAQELNCNVKVIASQLQTADPKIFVDLQKSIFEFMSNRKWTGDNFQTNERIECTMLINISKEISSDKFSGTMTIQASRPVFNSSYSSTTFNYVDKDFTIQYAQYQPLDYQENANISNLTSMLAYYAYIILGYDYDSFSPKGGQQYFQKAQSIVNVCQNANEQGWKSFESTKNRYWLVTNLLDTKYDNYRTVFYKYHRDGMDKLYDKPEDGRKAITISVGLVSQLHETYPNSILEQIFFASKADELVKIYSGATPTEKTAAVNTLQKIDPNNTQKYATILTNK